MKHEDRFKECEITIIKQNKILSFIKNNKIAYSRIIVRKFNIDMDVLSILINKTPNYKFTDNKEFINYYGN